MLNREDIEGQKLENALTVMCTLLNDATMDRDKRNEMFLKAADSVSDSFEELEERLRKAGEALKIAKNEFDSSSIAECRDNELIEIKVDEALAELSPSDQ